MSVTAKTAKTAKTRARIACRVLKSYGEFDRAFDDCFEMGDGKRVMKYITKFARSDQELACALINRNMWYKQEGYEDLTASVNVCLGK